MTDPFVDVRLGNARIAKTSVIDNDLNPVWNEKFRIEVAPSSLDLTTLLLIANTRCATEPIFLSLTSGTRITP